jgi:DNA polymerase III delta prime subunit
VAEQYAFPEKPSKRQIMPEKALMEATPELQPYESSHHADISSSANHPDDSSTVGNEDGETIIAQNIQPQSNEPPFLRIAGMQDYVNQLKEMVVFPLLYPSFFNRLGIAPPRGVLFYGPPGTGKTLMARLLAESCSSANRKVSFFMRNGSDCLSKWIGEAERNMKLLFQKAKECQPSIIFFDEIDGLAPERSGRADQSHISLVSTLLALMDGLDDRGNVVVIGATNRIHALDPALRRPGRFDREFFFGLPDEATRGDIMKILTKTWDPRPSDQLLFKLAHMTHGYSGADLKGLCTEAALNAIRRIAPEAYESVTPMSESHFSDRPITVLDDDFYNAFRRTVPNARRCDESEQHAIPLPYSLLVEEAVDFMFKEIQEILGLPIPSLEPALNGHCNWSFSEHGICFDLQEMPSSLAFKTMKVAATRIKNVKILTLNLRKLSSESSVSTQLYSGILGEAKSMAPVLVLIPDLSGFERKDELAETISNFCSSLIPGEPILFISLNSQLFYEFKSWEVSSPSEAEFDNFMRFVINKELMAIVLQKWSKLETIIAYGKSVGLDLDCLLVSPFPDYPAFLHSLSIFPNHQDIIGCVQELLPLSTKPWYDELMKKLDRWGDMMSFNEISKLRLDIIRAVQNLAFPTPSAIEEAFQCIAI